MLKQFSQFDGISTLQEIGIQDFELLAQQEDIYKESEILEYLKEHGEI